LRRKKERKGAKELEKKEKKLLIKIKSRDREKRRAK
jgi:hypothetical protein